MDETRDIYIYDKTNLPFPADDDLPRRPRVRAVRRPPRPGLQDHVGQVHAGDQGDRAPQPQQQLKLLRT